MASDWKSLASEKNKSTLSLIPEKWRLSKIPSVEEQKDVTGKYAQQFFDPKEIQITETDAFGIAEKVAAGEWSAVEVTEAFCHRASVAHQLLNCLHEIFFDAALADAKALDAYYAEHKKTLGPLHGVPISLKDQFHVKNVETTMGYVGWIGTFEGLKGDPRQGTYESEMVRELRELGAVLYCKTSVPHTLMAGETVNNIIEYTYNPKDRYLSSGGSSGGEGALIGFRGSPAGLGTDIGGSIRIPAGFNGLFGIRPSAGRLPYEGMANSMDGQNTVLSVVGPLATTARSMRLMVQSILSRSPWLHDPAVVEIPWREELTKIDTSPGQLCFGVIKSDGVVNPQPPVARAINILTKAIESAGHRVIPWDSSSHEEGMKVAFGAFTYDAGKDLHGAFGLSGEPIAEQVLGLGEAPGEEMKASDLAANNIAQRTWRKKYLDLWNSTVSVSGTGRPIDAIICPVAPYAAARPKKYKYYNYTVWVNVVDYTSVVVPVTNADKSTDTYPADYTPLSDQDKEAQADYDADMYDGAHVSLQLVGRRYQEEKMIALAEYIGKLLGK